MSEKIAYKTLREKMIQPKDRIDRIETGVDGIPDTNYCINGKEGWIEIKAPTEPKRPTTKLFASNHRVSQDQINWMTRQFRAKGRAHFLIVTDKRWILLGMHFAEFINDMTVDMMLTVALWHAPKPVRDKELWNKLREMLQR
jgi:hypothetical protein